jgi:hypothetical protein
MDGIDPLCLFPGRGGGITTVLDCGDAERPKDWSRDLRGRDRAAHELGRERNRDGQQKVGKGRRGRKAVFMVVEKAARQPCTRLS